MTNYINHKESDGLIKLSGRIKNYRQSREEASFVLTRGDRRTMGVVSVALSAAGMGGQAIGGAINASHIEEEADKVSFDLDGKPMRGWLWRSPFKEDDEVELVAFEQSDHYEIVAVSKPSERLIALYPHCVRGRKAFFNLAAKWWLIFTLIVDTLLLSLLVWFTGGAKEMFGDAFWFAWMGMAAMFTFVIAMLMRQWVPFVRTAQRVFNVFGWKNASSIDLVRTTHLQRKPGDPPELGVYYFKY